MVCFVPDRRHQFRDELTWRQVTAEHDVSSVAPWTGVDGHGVLPLMLDEMTWVVSVATRVEVAMMARHTNTPAIIRHDGVFHGTDDKMLKP